MRYIVEELAPSALSDHRNSQRDKPAEQTIRAGDEEGTAQVSDVKPRLTGFWTALARRTHNHEVPHDRHNDKRRLARHQPDTVILTKRSSWCSRKDGVRHLVPGVGHSSLEVGHRDAEAGRKQRLRVGMVSHSATVGGSGD
jgi:hypothetical protein